MTSKTTRFLQIGLCLLTTAALGALSSPPAPAQVPLGMPVIELKAGGHPIRAEVASTDKQRAQGLMYRNSLEADRGMLFVFSEPGLYCFWMKNTLIPLTIAFMNDDGRIVGTADMAPKDERSHCPDKPVRYALEMNQGWFRDKKLGAGDPVTGLPTP
ncbi:MAG: DUF192 domain-containing protein [Lautropia sp.]|nr:DUF192 domain-containing protein [Lautropia sp.]